MLVWTPEPEAADLLAEAGGVPDGVELDVWDGDDLPGRAEEVEVVVPPFLGDESGLDALARLPRLRLVQSLSAGVDALVPHVPDGVVLCRAVDVHAPATAEWVGAAVLASLREIPTFVRAQDERRWAYQHTPTLLDRTVLVVGAGSIGRAVRDRLVPFGCDVVLCARTAREGVESVDRLPELLPDADVVVLLVPLTEDTRGMVDAGFLGRMREGALLVNAARGPVVDTDALLDALHDRRVRAALDVTDPEPLPDGHPLFSAPGLLLTPHVAGSVPTMRGRQWRFVRAQLERLQAGDALEGVVEQSAGY